MSDPEESSSNTTESTTETPTPPPKPKRKPSSSSWQTRTREVLVPYLPPPVIRAMGNLDAQLAPSVGPEASITLGTTFLAMWVALFVVRFLTQRLTGRGRAVAGEDDDHVLSQASARGGEAFDVTVLLCGPPGGGKTRLFYHLCTGDVNVPTLTSLKANVGIAARDRDRGDTGTIRYIDWPGHAPIFDEALADVWKGPTDRVRVVLVLDATQPVAAAANVLYQIWELAVTSSSKQQQQRRTVWIACHKKDFPKAKNAKRVKIQMRTELERLVTTKKPAWWSASREVELHSLQGLDLHFCSTTCESNTGLMPLEEYCRQGKLPESSD